MDEYLSNPVPQEDPSAYYTKKRNTFLEPKTQCKRTHIPSLSSQHLSPSIHHALLLPSGPPTPSIPAQSVLDGAGTSTVTSTSSHSSSSGGEVILASVVGIVVVMVLTIVRVLRMVRVLVISSSSEGVAVALGRVN